MSKHWIIDGAIMFDEDIKQLFTSCTHMFIGTKSMYYAKLGMAIIEHMKTVGLELELVIGKTGHYLKKVGCDNEDEEY